jgi:RNA polymerase sigma-70 factor, ECF subfamily
MKDPDQASDASFIGDSVGSTSSSLLERAKARDGEAWRRLAHLYGPLVYRWCRRKGLPRADAEDLVQEVFLTVATKLQTFRREGEGDTFRGWLWTITRNKIGDWIRSHRQETRNSRDGEAALSTSPAPQLEDSGSDFEEMGGLYRRALDSIRPEFQETSWQAFWLVTIEDQSATEVAQELGISRNAVYVAKSRILRRLREILGDV